MFRSPYFETAMVTEVGGKKEMKMEIKECSPEVLHEALNYMHGVDIAEDFQELGDLMEMGNRFLMDDLREEAGHRLAKKLSEDNYIEISKIADKFNDSNLAKACSEFVLHEAEASKVDWAALWGAGLVATTYMEMSKMFRKSTMENKMKIFVKRMTTGKTTTLWVKPSATIEKVKMYFQRAACGEIP